MQQLTYLSGYSEQINEQVRQLLADEKLGDWLLKKYQILCLLIR